ncbi:hypothetical protein C8R46DRAFT_1236090 [Mycena filopes]|nr:hypothetical protein C8R46DRAFT_1236090 [Mycena filopes]
MNEESPSRSRCRSSSSSTASPSLHIHHRRQYTPILVPRTHARLLVIPDAFPAPSHHDEGAEAPPPVHPPPRTPAASSPTPTPACSSLGCLPHPATVTKNRGPVLRSTRASPHLGIHIRSRAQSSARPNTPRTNRAARAGSSSPSRQEGTAGARARVGSQRRRGTETRMGRIRRSADCDPEVVCARDARKEGEGVCVDVPVKQRDAIHSFVALISSSASQPTRFPPDPESPAIPLDPNPGPIRSQVPIPNVLRRRGEQRRRYTGAYRARCRRRDRNIRRGEEGRVGSTQCLHTAGFTFVRRIPLLHLVLPPHRHPSARVYSAHHRPQYITRQVDGRSGFVFVAISSTHRTAQHIPSTISIQHFHIHLQAHSTRTGVSSSHHLPQPRSLHVRPHPRTARSAARYARFAYLGR